jgi:hypothetical protein
MRVMSGQYQNDLLSVVHSVLVALVDAGLIQHWCPWM